MLIPLSPPECASRSAHMMCSEQQAQLLVPIWDNRLQYSRAPPPHRYTQAALVNIICIRCYYFCHFLTLLFAALVPLFSTSVSSPINNPPLIAFFPPQSHFSPIHLNIVNLASGDRIVPDGPVWLYPPAGPLPSPFPVWGTGPSLAKLPFTHQRNH